MAFLHGCPYHNWTKRPRCRTGARGGNRSQGRGREIPARTDHFHGWVSAGRRCGGVCSGMEWGIQGGYQTHMGYNQEVYDAERAALARALETVARAQPAPERITIFTDARAAIRRMWSEEPSPGQRYAPGKKVCSGAAEGQTGHQHRDPVVPCAQGHSRKREGGPVGETRGRGARHKWSGVAGLLGSSEAREMTLPRSLAHLKREITEKKCEEARKWAGSRTSGQKYRTPKSRRPDGKIAGSTKRLASRACQLKSRHARTRQYLH